MTITITLLADGRSDRALEPIIRLALDEHWPGPYRLQTAGGLGVGHRLQDRLPVAIQKYPCDLLMVHRDAEGLDPGARGVEVLQALEDCAVALPSVALIPVRMTEAWLLADEGAIRRAVGNPHGRTPLELPAHREIEAIGAKDVLFRALELASELGARRRHKFDPHQFRHRVADNLDSLVPLRQSPSFRTFEAALRAKVAGMN